MTSGYSSLSSSRSGFDTLKIFGKDKNMELGYWIIALTPPASAIALCMVIEWANKPTLEERTNRNAELIRARREKINHNQQKKADRK